LSEAHAPAAWWEDVEHLREAAERRIAERERARREGRDPGALPPLRPLRESERSSEPALSATPAPRPLEPAPARPTGRFARLTGGGSRATSPGPTGRAATATATALAVELEPAPDHEHDASQPFAGFAALADDFRASLEPAAHPDRADAPDVAPRRRHGDAPPADERLHRQRGAAASAAEATLPGDDLHRRPVAAAPDAPAPESAPARDHAHTRREELSRLAREQARAGAASRPRGAEAAARPLRAGVPAGNRRTIEIRGQVAPRPVIAAVPDPHDGADAYRARRRRPRRSPAERFIAQPDRIALWAFLLGLFLIVVALASAHS
jgi:hypothetical protein